MNKEIAMKWADALESGKYIQGTGQLCKYEFKEDIAERQHCCLGVLAELVDPDFNKRGENGLLYSEAIEKSELQTKSGYIPSHENHLYIMNDKGSTFKEIAQIIRTHWEEL